MADILPLAASGTVRKPRLALAVLGAACALSAAHVQSASTSAFPTRPMRILVPLTAGGNMDGISRGLAQGLSAAYGNQTVIVDNRPSAGAAVCLDILSKSAPDGHTIMTSSLTSVIHPMLYTSKFDVLRDFAPVSQVTAQGYVMVVNTTVPAKSASELVQHLKANPGKLSFMSTGIGSPIHLAGELFLAATGTRMLHIPYKGAAYSDIVSGLVQVGFPTVVSAMPFLSGGRLRALAVTTPKRMPSLPDVPTFAEGGVNGVVVTNWYGILAPLRTPPELVGRISKDIAAAMRTPEMNKRLSADSSEAVGSSPAEFTAHIKAETERWAKVIKQAGIRGE